MKEMTANEMREKALEARTKKRLDRRARMVEMRLAGYSWKRIQKKLKISNSCLRQDRQAIEPEEYKKTAKRGGDRRSRDFQHLEVDLRGGKSVQEKLDAILEIVNKECDYEFTDDEIANIKEMLAHDVSFFALPRTRKI